MGARILVLEDNRANLDLMLYLLRAFGHAATEAMDGLTGLQLAADGDYDVILCDVLMPGIDGFEVARRYKSQTTSEQAPLVAVTALAMVGDKERLLSAGFDGYIPKPIDPETFVTQVERFFPAALRSPSDVSPVSATVESMPRSPSTGPVILAVDDLQVNLEVVGGALRPFGYRVVEARSVRDAIVKAAETRPALVLCDVHMPDGDGFELLQEMKASPDLEDVPFFFLSSTAWRTSDQVRGMQLGAKKFLLRPLDPRTLREEVEETLAESVHGEDPDR